MPDKENYYFDKTKFAELLSKAQGDRSINQYGMNSGVSPTYISKLLRSLIEKAPGAKIIKQLADKASNGVTYNQLMQAAGHLSSFATVSESSAPYLTPADQIDTSDLSDADVNFLQFMRRAGPNLSPEQKQTITELGKVFLKQSAELDELNKKQK